MTYIMLGIIALSILGQLLSNLALNKTLNRIHEQSVTERADLLDRIQAPSLAEYKALTVKPSKPEPVVRDDLAQI